MAIEDEITLIDVTARDGLQDAEGFVPLDAKLALLRGVAEAGFKMVEATSFVHPRWVPKLADADEVYDGVRDIPGVEWIALVPNRRGFERALAHRVQSITVVCSASDAHNRANLNRSREETLHELGELVVEAHRHQVRVRGAISTAFDCPFSGPVALGEVMAVAEAYLEMGVDEMSLADTLGTANPKSVGQRVRALNQIRGRTPLSLHLHDRFGWALANVAMALEAGVEHLECALGGLGGCPFAPGAAANLDAERLIPFLEAMGIRTGIDLEKVREVREALWVVLEQRLPIPAV
ncbi:MAG: hydroxymethylglutaryl-CoA lyase [Firmicutes bacterium]|nr:hydroxymethylglutaryl-CoA lyase [Bacillota bacterium]